MAARGKSLSAEARRAKADEVAEGDAPQRWQMQESVRGECR